MAPMPCVKQANKHRAALGIVAAALTLGVSLAAAPAASNSGGPRAQSALPPAPMPDAQRYERCLDLAHSDPQRAFAEADAWRNLGGGFPAQHCAAVALVGLKKYPEAATQLEAL